MDIFKIDVQGSELLVLRGAERLIKAYEPVILTEASIVPFNTGGPSFFEMHVYMESIGYVIADIVEQHVSTITFVMRMDIVVLL